MRNSIITVCLVVCVIASMLSVSGCSNKVVLYGPFGDKIVARPAKFPGETTNSWIQADWCDFKWTHCPQSFDKLYNDLKDYKKFRLISGANEDTANKECQEILARVYKRALEANCPDASNEIAKVFVNDYSGEIKNIASVKFRNRGKLKMNHYPPFKNKGEIAIASPYYKEF